MGRFWELQDRDGFKCFRLALVAAIVVVIFWRIWTAVRMDCDGLCEIAWIFGLN
jgi:hypothetical protein